MNFSLDGVLEPVTDESPLDSETLSSDPSQFENYRGVESDPEAVKPIGEYVNRGWVRQPRLAQGIRLTRSLDSRRWRHTDPQQVRLHCQAEDGRIGEATDNHGFEAIQFDGSFEKAV